MSLDEQAETPENDVRMTIWEHLQEFRVRVVRAAIGLFIGTALCWNFRVNILHWLTYPYEREWFERKFPGVPELQTLSPADTFVGYLQLSFVGGFCIAIPIVFYQLWAFISPGLYARERKFVYPFVFFSTFLFLSGVAFAYYVALPFTISYFFSLLGQISEGGMVLTQRPTMEYYLDFVTRMLIAFGFVFELPLFITFMGIAGIVTPKQLLKFSRWAILLSFILGAIVTPGPEVTSQIAVSGALVLLYFMSIGLCYMFAKKKDEPTEAPAAPDASE
ncbi:MAG: twin-arginine translocase subunit TatC [Polyangiaceae bacterium]